MPDTYDITQPYLGLIEKYRPKPQEVPLEEQRKIARGNAIAEAFRLLIDTAGGAKGATIQQRDVTNPVLKAVDKYNAIRDQNRKEQGDWDKMGLGQSLKALETEAGQKYSEGVKESDRAFTKEQAEEQRTFSAGESKLTRDQNAEERAAALKQGADQFRETMGFKREELTTDAAIKREQIVANQERYRIMYPDGREKGMVISDADIKKRIRIHDDKKSQVLSYIEKDETVKGEIPILRMRYGNVGNEVATDFLIADLYPAVKPETRAQIRQFLGEEGGVIAPKTTTLPKSLQGTPLEPYPYQPGKGPLQTQPTIKTTKGSTIVEASQPEPQGEYQPLQPNDITYINLVMSKEGYSAEVKRSVIYQYLIENGTDEADAKAAAEEAYRVLVQK